MEDILASIRRILSEDETPAAAEPAAPPPPPPPRPEVLALDESMLVEEEPEPEPEPRIEVLPLPGAEQLPSLHAERAIEPPPPPPPLPEVQPIAATESRSDMTAPIPDPFPPAAAAGPLVAPEAAAAAASSVGSLLRSIGNRHNVALRGGGPTIEDLVRDELRPALKAWLDTYLPPLVERLVRAEIERVVGRVDL